MNTRGVLFILSATFYIIACKNIPGEEPIPTVESNRDTSATPVRADLCREGLFEYRIEANGIIKSDKELKLYADQGGLITYSIVKNGISVGLGQTLIRYDTTDIALKLDRAEIIRYNSSKDYESQILSYNKLMQELSVDEKKEIQKKIYVSSGLAMADQEIKELKYNLQKSVIKAPYSGIIANARPVQGQVVRSGEELCTLLSHTLIIECQILESDLPMIHLGQLAEIFNISNPDQHIKGTIREINPIIDASGIALIDVQIASTKYPLYSGMHGRAIIKVPSRKTLLVPKEAVVIRGNRAVVFTIEGNLAKWNYVEAGRNNGVDIEVNSGLKSGDKVIVTNNLQLAHEAVVSEEK